MPIGVYERRPYMRSYGRTRDRLDEIRALRESGWSLGRIGKRLGIAAWSVYCALDGEWNRSRKGKPGMRYKAVLTGVVTEKPVQFFGNNLESVKRQAAKHLERKYPKADHPDAAFELFEYQPQKLDTVKLA